MHSLGRFDDAISKYERALFLDKKCAMALAYKGMSLGEQGKVDEALDCFKEALQIDKDYDVAHISKKIAESLLNSDKTIRKKSII